MTSGRCGHVQACPTLRFPYGEAVTAGVLGRIEGLVSVADDLGRAVEVIRPSGRPKLTVTPTGVFAERACDRNRSATSGAWEASVSGSSTANSSPPSRPTTSVLRAASRSAWTTPRSVASPTS